MDSQGVIMFNRGPNMVVRAMVTLYSLRKHYDGAITFYIEQPTPKEFEDALTYFKCDIVHNEQRNDMKTLVRKNSMFENAPYHYTLWLDIDTVIVQPIDGMFDALRTHDVDFCIPHFCGWYSDGKTIRKRINNFVGVADDRYIQTALKHYPAVNTGILSFRTSPKWSKFVQDWTSLAHRGAQKKIFIPDEVACQILYPSMQEWGLKYHVCESDYNVSPLHDHGLSKSPRIYHFHGDKHVLDVPTCEVWKKTFQEMVATNIANINHFVEKYSDKRLIKYLRGHNGLEEDVTVVTACDTKYVEFLKQTYPNWVKHKQIDKYAVIVFVNGMDVQTDPRLDFLRQPNVRMIPWSKENDLDGVTDHREEMLSAFVFGAARYVTTDYWLKLDADSYATDNRPLLDESMKQYAFCGHKWKYSRPENIRKLDAWAKTHWRGKLKHANPMINEGAIEGNRFYHNVGRTISFIQLHKTKFTKFCVGLLKSRRLPVPSQDTYMFYVCNRFDPHLVGTRNFKKHHGFTQGNSRQEPSILQQQVEAIAQPVKVAAPTAHVYTGIMVDFVKSGLKTAS